MSERAPIVIQKNAREEFRISRDTFRGHDLVSIRVWFKADDGSMRPSKDGVTLRVALVDEVIEALQAAKAGAQ
jgi:hypothetical protein